MPRRVSQDGKLPLHYAAAKGASLEVMSLLLDANRDAPGIKDNVRRCTHTPCMPLARCYPTYEYIEAVCALRTAMHTQGMKLSLHHAAVNGAPFDVMKLLLDANSEAVHAADKVPRRCHARPPRCCCRCNAASSSSVCSAPLCMVFCQCHAVHGASQDGKLPLHYAAAKGAPFDVMKLLLDANLEGATSKDKARS